VKISPVSFLPGFPRSNRIKYGTVSETCTTSSHFCLSPRFSSRAYTCVHERFLSRGAVSSPYHLQLVGRHTCISAPENATPQKPEWYEIYCRYEILRATKSLSKYRWQLWAMTPLSTMLSHALYMRGNGVIRSSRLGERSATAFTVNFWHNPTIYDDVRDERVRSASHLGATMLLATRCAQRERRSAHARERIYFRGLMQTGCAHVIPLRVTATGQRRCIHEVIAYGDKNNRRYASKVEAAGWGRRRRKREDEQKDESWWAMLSCRRNFPVGRDRDGITKTPR